MVTMSSGQSRSRPAPSPRWEVAMPTSPARRRSADRQPGGLRGPAGPAAGAGPHAKGGPRQDLGAGTGRAVPRFRQPGPKARLELAADYLVMAAWLAFLKSKLLLPREEGRRGPAHRRGAGGAPRLPPEAAGGHAQRRGRALMTRKRLGRDIFARGMPEGVRTIRMRQYTA